MESGYQPAMVSDRIAQLSPRERDCLQLVGQGRSSKEIALDLGLSPFTVDEYVKSAVATLGAKNRREAARLLIAETSETPTIPQKLGDEPEPIADSADSAPPSFPNRGEALSRFRVPFLRQGRQFNDLSSLQRLVWILVGAVAIIVLFAQLSHGMQVIQSMFKGR